MKKKNIIPTIILVVCVGLFAGAMYLFNEVFPKAKPIRYPEIKDIVSVTLGCNSPDGSITMSELCYEDLLLYIDEAKSTRKQALDDYPSVRPYYSIEIQTVDKEYRYYIYEGTSDIYIEMPYEGIYTSKIELLDLVLTYFEEG